MRGLVNSVYIDVGTRSCLRLPSVVRGAVPIILSDGTRGTCGGLRARVLLRMSRSAVSTKSTTILAGGLLRLYGKTICSRREGVIGVRSYGLRTFVRLIRKLGKGPTLIFCGFRRSGRQVGGTLTGASLQIERLGAPRSRAS